MLFVSFSILCYAQGSSGEKHNIWIGPKVGLDLSNFTYNMDDIQYQVGMNYQVGILFQFGKTLYLQPEVYYASYKSTSETDETITTNYIKAPVMLGLRLLNLGIVSVHAMGGPAFNYKLGDEDIAAAFKTYSWQVGAGVDVLGFITADLRYTLQKGVTVEDQIDNFSLESTGLNLTVGLKLR